MKPIFHSFPARSRGIEAAGLTKASKFVVSKQQETNTSCIYWVAYDVDESGEVLVYPTVYPVPPPAPQARYHGDTQLNKIGRRGEFFGLREYRDGDDRRSIHWRSSARSNRLLVREYEEEAQQRTTILIDNALPAGALRK